MRFLFPTSVIVVSVGLGLLLRNAPDPMTLFEPGSFVTLAIALGLTGFLIPLFAPFVKALTVAVSMALCCHMPLFWILFAIFERSASAIYLSYLLTTILGALLGGAILQKLSVNASSPVSMIGAATHFVFISVAAGLQHGTTRPPITQDLAWIMLLPLSWWLGWLMKRKISNSAD